MRPLSLGTPPGGGHTGVVKWIIDALQKIQNASRENDPVRIGQAYTISGTLTETRSINVDTASDAEIRQVLGTVLTDLARGGAKKT